MATLTPPPHTVDPSPDNYITTEHSSNKQEKVECSVEDHTFDTPGSKSDVQELLHCQHLSIVSIRIFFFFLDKRKETLKLTNPSSQDCSSQEIIGKCAQQNVPPWLIPTVRSDLNVAIQLYLEELLVIKSVDGLCIYY